MTYCVAMTLNEGMLFASDSRTNAGVDHVSTFCKMSMFQTPNERCIVLLTAGNLATSQTVVNLLKRDTMDPEGKHILNAPSMFDCAEIVGNALRGVINRNEAGQQAGSDVDFTSLFVVGGQIKGEEPRLFMIYAQGNFIEAMTDTPYFQIGESKYGKPIIDRVVRPETPLREAVKSALVSFDSTMKSNLSVGLPIDVLILRRDQFAPALRHRVTEDDEYFDSLRTRWGQGLRKVFSELPEPDWYQPH